MCTWRFRIILPMDSRCKRRSLSQNSTQCTLDNSNGERRCLFDYLFHFVWRMRRQNAPVMLVCTKKVLQISCEEAPTSLYFNELNEHCYRSLLFSASFLADFFAWYLLLVPKMLKWTNNRNISNEWWPREQNHNEFLAIFSRNSSRIWKNKTG